MLFTIICILLILALLKYLGIDAGKLFLTILVVCVGWIVIIGIGVGIGKLTNRTTANNSIVQSTEPTSDTSSEESYDTLNDMTGENTYEFVGTDVDVEIGKFQVSYDEYGFASTSLPVRITNLSDDRASYSITIEATNPDGSRLELAYAFANQLNSGQSYDTEVFQYRTEEEIDAFQNADYSVFEVQKY